MSHIHLVLEVRGGTSMRVRIVTALILFILLVPTHTSAKSVDKWQELDHISDQALQFTKGERYENAKQMLEYFSDEFIQLTVQTREFSMDELRMITVTHHDALHAVTNVKLPHEERVRMVTQFRLVVDAVYSDNEPLWTAMEESIMTSFNQMKATVVNSDGDHFKEQLHSFLTKYEVIHPSVKIDVSPEKVQKLDAHIRFLDSSNYQAANQESQILQMSQMDQDLKSLFDETKEDEADPSLIWVMISTGSFIVLTLSYVAWRKYKGDKQKRESRKGFND